jgi:hypothetical protein
LGLNCHNFHSHNFHSHNQVTNQTSHPLKVKEAIVTGKNSVSKLHCHTGIFPQLFIHSSHNLRSTHSDLNTNAYVLAFQALRDLHIALIHLQLAHSADYLHNVLQERISPIFGDSTIADFAAAAAKFPGIAVCLTAAAAGPIAVGVAVDLTIAAAAAAVV